MNRIEKAEWAARPQRRDAGESRRAVQLSGPPRPWSRCSSPHFREPGLGGAGITITVGGTTARALHPSCLPFICWLCHFLSIADPFSVPSVISNNVTASLESIHQSRKKPMLTLIKKNTICASQGRALNPTSGAPACPRPPAISWGHPGVIRFRAGRVPSHRRGPTPELTCRAGGDGF